VDRKLAKPRPRTPSRFSCGTRTSVNVSGWVSEAFQPTLSYAGSATKPSEPDGTMIVEISFLPFSFCPVTAVTVTSEVMSVPELVMNCFEPLMMKSSPSSRATVRVAPASEPASGSVRPKPARALPAVRSGSHFCFCSSLPKW
jgi:hypothetical protein